MITGTVPMRLTSADVWRLMRDRFNANEIAYLAGVSVPVALGMMNQAVPRARRRTAVLTLKAA